MIRLLTPGATYFAVVFAAGFVLGTIRTLLIAPRVGARVAECMEFPVVLVVIILTARRVTAGMAVPPGPSARLTMGGIALLFMLAAEFGVVRWIRRQTITAYLATRDPITGSVYVLMLAIFATMPLFV